MKYISTRGGCEPCSSAQAIKQGLAGDGGLFLPDRMPELSDQTLKELCACDYPTRAAKVLYMFLNDDYTYDELLSDCKEAYSEAGFPGGPAPISSIGDNIRVLELWHGPTSAFKDMALQIMPRLFSRAIKKTNDKRQALILVATSGDTGKAALEGYRDIDGVRIMVFYPQSGVSRVQKLQMATQIGNNVFVQSVIGNFDDAQNGVKKIFSSDEMRAQLDSKGIFLSSANSINWGRLVPQVVYYISAYCDLVNKGDITIGEDINVCVPTGNFGNILAAYIAKMMGLPIHDLVCASNKNKILTDFFETGIYDRNREFYTTASPSMDILISSNLERLLYLKSGSEKTAEYMKELSEKGKYRIGQSCFNSITRSFCGGYCDEENTAKTIKHIYEDYNYLCDTHTAVAMYCTENFLKNVDGKRKILTVSTASPYKFSPSVYAALTGEHFENELDAIGALLKLTGVEIPLPLKDIEKREIRFDPEKSIKAEDMPKAVLEF